MDFDKDMSYHHSYVDDDQPDLENVSLRFDPRIANLSDWQRRKVEGFPVEGQQCLIDFWVSPLPEGVFCNATWDNHTCWRTVPANTTSTMPCPEDLHRDINISDTFAYRTCNADGVWQGDWTDYTICVQTIFNRLSETVAQRQPHYWNEDTHLALMLMYIYFYGGIVSCVFLTITLFIFSYFKKLQCSRISIHKNLVMSFILRFLILIVWFEPFITDSRLFRTSYRDMDWLCKTMNVLVYYSLLANVAWMFVEGVFLHGRVTISVFNAHPPFKIYYFIGWVVPGLIVTVWAICVSKTSHHRCWNQSFKHSTAWIVMAPVTAVLALNLLFLVNIIRIMVTKLGANRTLEVNRIRKAVKATTFLFPLLGATNLLFVMDSRDGVAYRITNAVLQSSQGIFVSVIYCFLNDEVKTAVLRKWQLYRNRRIDRRHRFSSATKTSAKCTFVSSQTDRSSSMFRSKWMAASSPCPSNPLSASASMPPAVILLGQTSTMIGRMNDRNESSCSEFGPSHVLTKTLIYVPIDGHLD